MPSKLLKYAGYVTVVLAVFQAVITTVPSWALYFGATEDVVSRPWLLYISGYFVAVVFFLFALYAFSASGIYKSLPFIKAALILICFVFLLRGIIIIPEILSNAGIINMSEYIPPQAVISSGVSLAIGLLYLAGTIKSWKNLHQQNF